MTADEKKKLLAQIRELKADIRYQATKRAHAENLVEDYKARHDHAVMTLVDLSQGIGTKPTWYKEGGAWKDCMAYYAAQASKVKTLIFTVAGEDIQFKFVGMGLGEALDRVEDVRFTMIGQMNERMAKK